MMSASSSTPEIVWVEDHVQQDSKPAPRTLPLGYAQQQADRLLERLPAIGRPRQYRLGWRAAIVGVACLSAAAIMVVFQLDVAFLRTPSILLSAFGVRELYLGVMGERR